MFTAAQSASTGIRARIRPLTARRSLTYRKFPGTIPAPAACWPVRWDIRRPTEPTAFAAAAPQEMVVISAQGAAAAAPAAALRACPQSMVLSAGVARDSPSLRGKREY